MFTAGNLDFNTVVVNTQFKLKQLRQALADIQELHDWSSAVSASDLQSIGAADATQANALLSAIADAAALATINATGQAPSTYPQVSGTPYVFAASQRQVIGPQ